MQYFTHSTPRAPSKACYGRMMRCVTIASPSALNPDAESATVALASPQFMRDDVSQIDRVFNHTRHTTDPGLLIGYGSFIHWSALKAAMPAAVPASPPAPK